MIAGIFRYLDGRNALRLCLKGIVQRIPHSNRYLLTPMGRRVCLF